MAVIGDVLVKLVADFAEFAQGMDQGIKKLDEFGKQATKTNEDIKATISQVRDAIAGLFVVKVGRELLQYLDQLQQKFTEIGETAKKLGVGFDAFEQMRLSAMKAGVGTQTLTDAMQRFKSITDQAVGGGKDVIDTLNKLGVTILDNNGKLRDQTEINRRLATAILAMPPGIERMRTELKLLGVTGDDASKILQQMVQSQDTLQNKFGSWTLGTSLEELEKLKSESKASREEIELMITALATPIEAKALHNIRDALKQMTEEAKNFMSLSDFWDAMKSLGVSFGKSTAGYITPEGVRAATPSERLKFIADDAAEQISKIEAEYKRLETVEGNHTYAYMRLAKEREAAERTLREATQALYNTQRRQQGPDPTDPGLAITVVGKRDGSNPPPVGGGGGGGRSDADDINAIIARYKQMTAAAKEAQGALRANQQADVDDLARIVQARQEAQNIITRIEQHKTVPAELKQALEDAINAAKAEEAQTAKSIQVHQQAFETEKRYGDGKVALARVERDLTRQRDTGRLSQEAYNRALREGWEAAEQAALAAKRYDDDLGSLAAGFEHAANANKRANDLFSVGEKAFTGLTDAMGEGLDVLLGKSQKTFGEIAADFASMLAKMAMQAAVSQVFGMIFGSATGSTAAPLASALYGSASSVVPGLTYGGPRQHGGPVIPGVAYTVGESGPERFVPHAAGTIVPANSNSSTSNITVNVDMNQQQGAADPSAALAFGRKVKAAVADVIAQEKRPGGSLYQRMSA
jgi:phage-related minor tail protein